jgi:hypothetical protein
MRKLEAIEPDPWHFPGPELAEACLEAFDRRLSSARGPFARRRMGKTEFPRRDLLPAAAAVGYRIACANLWDNRSTPLKQWTEMNPADQAVITMLARGKCDLHARNGMAKLIHDAC